MSFTNILTHFRADLIAQSAVSSGIGQRVFFGIVPKDQPLPAITLNAQDGSQDVLYGDSRGLRTFSIQVGIYSTSGLSNIQLYDAIFTRYNGFKGQLNSNANGAVLTTTVGSMFTTHDARDDTIIGTVFEIEFTTGG